MAPSRTSTRRQAAVPRDAAHVLTLCQGRFGGRPLPLSAGAGVEFAVSGNWSAKAEYLYARFGGTDVIGRLSGADGQSPALGFVDGAKFTNALSPLELHLFRVGVNYRFY